MRGILSLACAYATAANLHRTAPRTLCPPPVPRLGAANQKVSPPACRHALRGSQSLGLALGGGLTGVGFVTEWFSLPQQVQHVRLSFSFPQLRCTTAPDSPAFLASSSRSAFVAWRPTGDSLQWPPSSPHSARRT
eukprot:188469-Pyramimonas_sp.AAC.2